MLPLLQLTLYASAVNTWTVVLVQVPSEPSRHRVAVWRELRKVGAVPVAAGAWALPASAAFEEALGRAATLTRNGGGTFAVLDVTPRDDEAEGVLRHAYTAARLDEWHEFEADCGKFEAEIAKEIAKAKLTFAELEEEEQSLDRLRRWYRELKRRDVFALPEAGAAEQRLRACETALEGYADQVYDAMHGRSGGTTPVG
jgi:hypothetical protein